MRSFTNDNNKFKQRKTYNQYNSSKHNLSLMPQHLLQLTFSNILSYQQQQHNFSQQQCTTIIQTIASTDRTTVIEQQLQSIVKQLQEKTISESNKTKLFRQYELEWVMNWLVEVYCKHLQLIKAYEQEVQSDRKRSENHGRGRSDNDKLELKECEEIQLLVDTPVIVEPLTKAKMIRDGAQPIVVD